MSRLRAAIVVFGVISLTGSASAATVGLDGGGGDPIPFTDPSWQLLNEADCPQFGLQDLPETYRCALYDGSAVGTITEFDFRLKDGHGNLIPFPDTIFVDDASFFFDLAPSTLFLDGFTFNFSGTEGAFSCFLCRFFSSHGDGIGDPLYVSIVGVNGTANPGAKLVPEPVTVLLLAPGAALVLRRRATWVRRQARRAARSAGR
jgi:hypothetical protein